MNSIETALTSAFTGVDAYVCPGCRQPLRHAPGMLHCGTCSQSYPIDPRGVPHFIQEDLWRSRDAALRRMRFIDKMARIYESNLWYPLVLNVYGGWGSTTLPQLLQTVCAHIAPVTGRVLDVACGPGTYGRRVASPTREVYGIDVSPGMLRQGAVYAARENIANIHFARARVEALPFPIEFFDAAICCGSLHLFPDKVGSLREIARVLKPQALLAVFTFRAGEGGILKHRRLRAWAERKGMHAFELPELRDWLEAAGFEAFDPKLSGSILTFTARRRAAR